MSTPSGLRVLIAEDDSVIAVMLQSYVTELGHVVVGEARHGREAVEMAVALRPDLILMDIRMPDMDGISACDRIMRDAPTAILILTSYTDPPLVSAANVLGVMGYLVKPIDARQLGPAIIVAHSRYRELAEHQHEKEAAERALAERKVVERAKGILMRAQGWTEEEAYEYIRRISRDHRCKKEDIARQIIAADGLLPARKSRS